MKRKMMLFLLALAAAFLLCACAQIPSVAEAEAYIDSLLAEVSPLPTVTAPPSATPVPTYIPRTSPSPRPSASASPSPSPSPRASESPSPSPSPTPTPSPTPSPSPTPTPSPTPSPTPEPTPIVYSEADYAPIPVSIPFSVPTIPPTPSPTPIPTSPPTTSPTFSDASSPSSSYDKGVEVADFACQYVGYPYKWGEESPETGFDCSGLVYYVYQHFGYTLNRTSSAMASNGAHVEPDSLEPGDVLCFYTSGTYMGHVGIYIGGGEYVHAQDSSTGVVISPLSERKYGFEARRILS